jgi:hypothetical protein
VERRWGLGRWQSVTRVTIKSFVKVGSSGGEAKQGRHQQQGSTNQTVTNGAGTGSKCTVSTPRPAAAATQQLLSKQGEEAEAAQQEALMSALVIHARLIWGLARTAQAPDPPLVLLLCNTLCFTPNVLPAPEWPWLLCTALVDSNTQPSFKLTSLHFIHHISS